MRLHNRGSGLTRQDYFRGGRNGGIRFLAGPFAPLWVSVRNDRDVLGNWGRIGDSQKRIAYPSFPYNIRIVIPNGAADRRRNEESALT